MTFNRTDFVKEKIIKEYDTTIDSKNRITIRGQSKKNIRNYNVKIFSDGRILLEPRVLVHPDKLNKIIDDTPD